MSLFEKAKELGQKIKESQEFKEVHRTGQNVENNADAQQIIQEFQMLHQQLEFAQNTGEQPDPEQIEEFNNLKTLMDNNITIKAYFKAQENYGQLMQEVNNIISEEINNK